MSYIFEPGFFSNAPVRTALVMGALVAIVSAVVGVVTIIRSQSFAGHALTDVATAGGSGATLVNINPLIGFITGAVIGSIAMEAGGMKRARQRDITTGIVLGFATGLSALFLYLDATKSANSGVTQQVLFGSIFTVSSSLLPIAGFISLAVIGAVAIVWRMLVVTSVNEEIAISKGAPTRLVGTVYMVALAAAVGLSSILIGSILSTALLIGPAATALRGSKSLVRAVFGAAGIGIAATWSGILLSYDSYYWEPSNQGLPVSFFIVVLIVLSYAVAAMWHRSPRK